MKKFIVLFSLITFFNRHIFAQDTPTEKKGYKYNNNFDLALATNGAQFSGALSWVKFHAITKKKRFKIGYGLRFTAQGGKDLYYVTAPAILTSKQTGPQVLFSETFLENVDTFFVSKSQNNSLNISINLQYTIKEKFDIGFNIDALGLSFGGSTTGKYIAYQSTDNGTQQIASTTSLNLLLVSDNDIGALNSELYFRYWFNQKWAFRVGASFLFTEYTTSNKLRLDNDRWRNKSLMGLVGITFSPFR
jgi:hypothetical protein